MFDTQFGSGFLGPYLLSLTDPRFRACDKRGVSVLLKSAINRCCNLVLTSAFTSDRLGRAWELGGADVRALGMGGHGTPGMGGPWAWPAVGSEI